MSASMVVVPEPAVKCCGAFVKILETVESGAIG